MMSSSPSIKCEKGAITMSYNVLKVPPWTCCDVNSVPLSEKISISLPSCSSKEWFLHFTPRLTPISSYAWWVNEVKSSLTSFSKKLNCCPLSSNQKYTALIFVSSARNSVGDVIWLEILEIVRSICGFDELRIVFLTPNCDFMRSIRACARPVSAVKSASRVLPFCNWSLHKILKLKSLSSRTCIFQASLPWRRTLIFSTSFTQDLPNSSALKISPKK